VGYLDESQFLGDAPQTQMQLPTELAQQLAADTMPDPGGLVPADMIRLPGGIIMKKTTAILLGIAIALAFVYWYTQKKKK
jgi:hypothetical protein